MGEQATDQDKDQVNKAGEDQEQANEGDGHRQEEHVTEKPEPNDEHREKAAEMMTAYEDRPTLVVPGTGGTIAGTAVNDWLDDDGNPKFADDENAPANKVKADSNKEPKDEKGGDEKSDDDSPGLMTEEQIEKDKAFNAEVLKSGQGGGKDGEDKAKDDTAEAKDRWIISR